MIAASITNPAGAAPADLDQTFGAGGKLMTDFDGYETAWGVAIDSNGKIVVAGQTGNFVNYTWKIALARYAANGTLDNTFGTGGKVDTSIGSGFDFAYSVAVDPDGRIVVAGASYTGNTYDFALVRYTVTGALDPTFGAGGKITTDLNGHDYGQSVALQTDGRIIVAGYCGANPYEDVALVRYTPSGMLDTSFGTGGKVTTAVGSSFDRGYGIVVQSDGKIVVVGTSYDGSNGNFAVVRYSASGALDASFGTLGKVTTDFDGDADEGHSVALQNDGKIVVGGTSSNGASFAVARYTKSGMLDMGFGTGGKMSTIVGVSGGNGMGNGSVIVQSDGKITVAGTSFNGSAVGSLALVRYSSEGALDPAFGTGGKVITTVGNDGSFHAMALQTDGKPVAVGTAANGNPQDFAVVRYLGANASGDLIWPAQNGYAHPLSKTSSTMRGFVAAEFLSSEYEQAPPAGWGVRHVGIDLEKSEGTTANGDPVYAIDDGEIVYFRRQLVGDGFYPVVFVRHQSASGQPFWAIYGHCNLVDSLYPRAPEKLPGDTEEVFLDSAPVSIAKGKQIGKIITAGEAHLHFGINTSASRGSFFTGSYGWGRVPLATSDAYLRDTLKWQTPIDQDNPVRLGWLNDSANTNNKPEQFSDWRTSSFAGTTVDPAMQTPDADADGDGIVNRYEYALSLDPLSSANEGIPKVEMISAGGETFPGFIHKRRRNATDLNYTVVSTSDFLLWDFTGTSVLQVGPPEVCPDGDSEKVTFRVQPSLASASARRFFFVLVTSPP